MPILMIRRLKRVESVDIYPLPVSVFRSLQYFSHCVNSTSELTDRTWNLIVQRILFDYFFLYSTLQVVSLWLLVLYRHSKVVVEIYVVKYGRWQVSTCLGSGVSTGSRLTCVLIPKIDIIVQ